MEHHLRRWARGIVVVSVVVALVQTGFAGKNCKGCSGQSGIADSALAPSPCLQSAWGEWEISVTADVYDGSCISTSKEGVDYCLGEPCQTSIAYAWGGEVADAGLSVGYYEDNGVRKQTSIFTFPDGDPWKKGEIGTVMFGPGNSPDISCGTTLQFFIEGDKCGKFYAEVYGNCAACGASYSKK
jgi:hypothetical protein